MVIFRPLNTSHLRYLVSKLPVPIVAALALTLAGCNGGIDSGQTSSSSVSSISMQSSSSISMQSSSSISMQSSSSISMQSSSSSLSRAEVIIVESENYDRFSDVSLENEGGCGGDVEVDMVAVTPGSPGRCDIGYTNAGEWLEYDVNIPESGNYRLFLALASANANRIANLSLDATPWATLTVPMDGWSIYSDIPVEMFLGQGIHTIRITFTTGETNFDALRFELTDDAASSWVDCAKEKQVCDFSGTKRVRYGVGDSWAEGVYTSTVMCGNATFGDPISGKGKVCQVADIAWVDCAIENAVCDFPGTKIVRYGVEPNWSEATFTDSVVCKNSVFTDPAPTIKKVCQVTNATSTNFLPNINAIPSQPNTGGAELHSQVIQKICVLCHSDTSLAKNSNLIFIQGDNSLAQSTNLASLDIYALNETPLKVLNKVKGLDMHGGGEQLVSTQPEYMLLLDYLEVLTGENLQNTTPLTDVVKESPESSFRRASLLLTGKVPSRVELDNLQNATDSTLRSAYLKLMNGQEFKEFIKRSANDKLLVRSELINRTLFQAMRDYYKVYDDKIVLKRDATGRIIDWDEAYGYRVDNEVAEAPLELFSYVIQNNKPYTEVLTANYTMVSKELATVFKTGLSPAAGTFVPAVNRGQSVTWAGAYENANPARDWSKAVELSAMPHAGVLTDQAFLIQYPTTATNRNRARSRWTYMHFLGVDIENSTARTIDSSALADKDNPTLKNPACTVCHERMDPVAGAFQSYSDRGYYRAGPGGLNSLDYDYRKTSDYTKGDVWYSTMLKPGFDGKVFDPAKDSMQELAKSMVADKRFAEGTIKFWWPAIFGEHFIEDLDENDQVKYDAKTATLKTLSERFRASNYNFKSLLADIFMSDWFRGMEENPSAPSNSEVGFYTGGKRLLTPEELYNKTLSISGVKDSTLLDELMLSFGGMDSVGTPTRQRDINHMMLRVAERHALVNSCTIVASEFNKPRDQRLLFTQIERDTVLSDGIIAQQVVVLIERTQGIVASSSSPFVTQYVDLFKKLVTQKAARGEKFLDEKNTTCNYNSNGKSRAQWASDNNHSLGAWRGMLVALMANYNYLYE